jgi:transcriptional regulator GlxA family with amidase domain
MFANLSFAPLAAFETANMVLGEKFYDMHLVSASGGQIVNSLGMRVETERGDDLALDTLLVGAPLEIDNPSGEVINFLQRASANTRRIASICVGAFILGDAGLLDGRRATTHWLFGKELQLRYPKTRVDMDRIYIADGQIWTSAGMTAGIDLALGLVERDLGPGKAREIARMMVLHHRRTGGQSQHSALLDMDVEVRSDRVQAVLQYARRNLSGNLSVERLAAVACLSPRQFSRLFRLETGVSPAKAVMNLRLEAARFLLEQGRLPIETIAFDTGFGDRERMRRSFLRVYSQSPQSIRKVADPLAAI